MLPLSAFFHLYFLQKDVQKADTGQARKVAKEKFFFEKSVPYYRKKITMKRVLNLIALITLLFSLNSCSKSEKSPLNTSSGCAVESFSEIYNGVTTRAFFYSYDSQGRITRIDFDSKPSVKYETYTYSSDKIVVSGTALGNGTAVYELDANGRVIRNGPVTYTYNNEGYLVKSTDVSGPIPTNITYTHQNGNLIRIDQQTASPNPQQQMVSVLFEYDAAQSASTIPYGDPINFSTSSRPTLGAYFGKGSKNLLKKESAITNSTADETRTHTYIRDDKGNITTIRTTVSDGRVGEKRFTYKCN